MTSPHETEVNPAASASLSPAPVIRDEHRESTVTRMIEHQVAKVPSDMFLLLSMGCMAVSLGAEITGRRGLSRFVGMWVAPVLVMGVYTKLVKTLGMR